jgi:phosphatidylserine/phosphatidylglycerophosphate/cardiolipin synthase-like enzyme
MNNLAHLIPIIQKNLKVFDEPGVVLVRPGFCSKDGWPTKTPGIIVATSKSGSPPKLPKTVDGVPVEVRKATRLEQLNHDDPEGFSKMADHRQELRSSSALPEFSPSTGGPLPPVSATVLASHAAKAEIQYTAPNGVALTPINAQFAMTCHVSPDAGWRELQSFIKGTKKRLAVSMYDFTSKHILDLFRAQLATKEVQITLDDPPKNPTANQPDPETIKELKAGIPNFGSSWALVRSSPEATKWIYPAAYHIKVMVRDSATVWLSSGNLNNSNQPEIDPTGAPSAGDQSTAKISDRDWHIIVDSPALAKVFEAYLNHDFQVATQNAANVNLQVPPSDVPKVGKPAGGSFTFAAPLSLNEAATITPMLTPDPEDYSKKMLALINGATTSLYIQLQYITPSDKPEGATLTQLIDAVAAKINAGKDVRIILSEFQTQKNGLDALQAAGVDLSKVKIQNNVHNKGFVIDHKTVVISSMNWSSEGVLSNRDAGVIVENQKAAKYYESVFLDDWENHAESKNPSVA